jgi:hypothetical protein
VTEIDAAYVLSIALPISTVISSLSTNLGTALVSHLAGTNPVTVDKWIAGASAPRQEMALRLRAGYRVFALIEEADGTDSARAWFIGMNPMLDDEPPATAIRDGRQRDVLTAARSFVATS